MTRVYTHDGLAISVDADADDQRWLEEFLAPAFSVSDVTKAAEVHIAFGPGRPPAGWTGEQTRVAFALDARPVALPVRPCAGGFEVHDPGGNLTYVVTNGGATTDVRYYGDRLAARARFLRVVREFAHNHSLHTGAVILHAAAVVTHGRTIIIAGDKRAGKTTLLLRWLAQGHASYLANDRVLVRFTADPAAVAIPTVVAVREGTRSVLPDVACRLSIAGDFRQHRGARTAEARGDLVTWQGDWHVSPAQVCEAVPCALAATAPIGALLFLAGDDAPGAALRALEPAQAAAAAARAVLCRRTHTFVSDVFTLRGTGTPPDVADMDARAAALSRAVSCVTGGVRRATALDAIEAWLATAVPRRS